MITRPFHYITYTVLIFIASQLSVSVTLHTLFSDASAHSAMLLSGPGLHYINCFRIERQIKPKGPFSTESKFTTARKKAMAIAKRYGEYSRVLFS